MCSLTITNNMFLCGDAGCGTINASTYTPQAAQFVYVQANSFENASVALYRDTIYDCICVFACVCVYVCVCVCMCMCMCVYVVNTADRLLTSSRS